ncbi:MAG: hypothetical protein ACREWI_14730, partial [Telluria sp.]
ITLRVAGDSISIPVPVAPNNSFVLPRNDNALREDAAVLANRKTTSMTSRAPIVTPGLPPGTRRLGDMRLECLVGVEAGLVSHSSPMYTWISEALSSPEGVCGGPEGNYLFVADRPRSRPSSRARRPRPSCWLPSDRPRTLCSTVGTRPGSISLRPAPVASRSLSCSLIRRAS